MNESEIKKAVKLSESEELTEAERKKKKGSFIELACGRTHYEIKGEGEPVVLVHGYATPYFIFDKVFDRLVAEGYKVLRYDLMGRGYSERIKAEYDVSFFALQLRQLTQALLGKQSFRLIGTSMGGGICAAFCAEYPESVSSLTLLAPAGMDSFKPPFYMKLCSIRGIGEIVFYIVAGKMLLKKCASELYHVSAEEKDYFQRSFADACRYKGFLRCTLSSLRNTILRTDETVKGYISVGKTDLPVLCIWGTADKTMPYYQSVRMKEVCPKAKLITYQDSGHVFLFDEGDRTTDDILEFYASLGAPRA